MASNFTLRTNVPRSEIYSEGWGKSKVASSIVGAELGVDWVTGEVGYIPSELPGTLTQWPGTGIITLTPWTFATPENAIRIAAMLKLAGFDYNPDQSFLDTDHDGAIYPERPDSSSPFLFLDHDAQQEALNTMVHGGNCGALLKTKVPLADNEGWSILLLPHGTYTTRATNFVGIQFGGRYYLHLRMDGVAELWSDSGTPGSHSFTRRKAFRYSPGGPQHLQALQLHCVPLGFNYIYFWCSAYGRSVYTFGRARTKSQNTYHALYHIASHEQPPPWDSIHKQYVKYPAAPLTIWGPALEHAFGVSMSKITYPETATLHCTKESLPEVKATNPLPILEGRGFSGMFQGSTSPARIGASYVNSTGGAWNKTVDTELVPVFTFESSSDRMYTPELWSYDLAIHADVHTPDWTPVDVSADWQYVRWQISTDPDVSTLEVKLHRQDDYGDILKLGGPIQLKYGSNVVFDGYIERKQPVLEGPRAILTDQIEARDMWLRLNECKVDDFQFLDGLSLLSAIVALIKRAGFLDADINVDDPDGYIANLAFGGFSDPNDQNGLNSDATVGDVIREAVKGFGLYPIRVRWANGQWQIYPAPQYDPASPPTKKFYLRSSLMDHAGESDATRYIWNEYKITGNPEWTTLPGFNGLIGRAATETSDGAQGLQSTIPPLQYNAASVTDPTNVDFLGRAKIVRVAPPEMAFPQDQLTLDQHTRAYWDRFHKGVRALEFPGEWQPEIDVDDFIWVIGVDQSGNRVSYGAYRIDFIDIEADKDWSSRNMGWDVHGSYSCVYVGEATDGSTPMFTDVLP